jgi:hypothetical protein
MRMVSMHVAGTRTQPLVATLAAAAKEERGVRTIVAGDGCRCCWYGGVLILLQAAADRLSSPALLLREAGLKLAQVSDWPSQVVCCRR